MKQYDIRFAQTYKIVLALIFVPLTIVPIIVYGAINIPNLQEWLIGTSIAILLTLATVLTIFVIKKISPLGMLTLQDDGFSVTFAGRNIFAPAPFTIKLSQVTNFVAEGKNGMYYLSFSTTGKPGNFNIEAQSKKDEDIAAINELIEVISAMVSKNNETHVSEGQVIAAVSMYESWWAKLIAVVAILMVLLVIALMIFQPAGRAPEWWRLATVFIFGVPFVYQVYYHNFKKKKKQAA